MLAFTKFFALLFVSALMTACTSNTDNPVGRPVDSQTNQQLALCAGGLDQGLSATLNAELQKRGGNVTAEFAEYARGLIFSSSNIESSDKAAMYSTYIDCVLKMRESQAAGDRCVAVKQGCMASANTMFQQCIKSQMRGCYRDCRRRGFSNDECVAGYCNYTKLSDTARQFYDNRCLTNEEYMDKEAECSEKYGLCLSGGRD
jgi:hypothetical protein